jgi:hypothetical protein
MPLRLFVEQHARGLSAFVNHSHADFLAILSSRTYARPKTNIHSSSIRVVI